MNKILVSGDDNDACTVDSCDDQNGCYTTAVDCDDSDTCTEDSCDSDTRCSVDVTMRKLIVTILLDVSIMKSNMITMLVLMIVVIF